MKTLRGDDIYPQIENMVKEAKSSIKIASAWLKGSLIRKLLQNINSSRNIKIEVILRASELRDLLITDEETFRVIQDKNGELYLNNRLHTKFIVVDDKMAVVGSANFTEAGMSDYSKGNIEVAVYYDLNDGEEVKNLVDYYETIKADAISFSDDLIGFILNPAKSDSFEFVLLDPKISEQSYVEVKTDEGTVLGEIKSIYSYDMGFFANPFSGSESQVFGSLDNFKLLFSGKKNNNWKKAAVHSYLNENGDKVKIAVAKILGKLEKDGTIQTLLRPLEVGTGIYKASLSTLKDLMQKNFSGARMKLPIRIGNLEGNKNIEAFIDLEEIISRHMAILGTTGSGKSHFTKLFIKQAVNSINPPQIFILDPHGEYYEGLKNFGIEEKLIEEIIIPDTILPVYTEDVVELLKDLGYGRLVSGNSKGATENKDIISKYVKPDLETTGLRNKTLKEVLLELKTKSNNNDMENEFMKNYFRDRWENQKEAIDKLLSIFNNETGKLIFILNLKKITDSKTRTNIAGLFLKKLFNLNKEDEVRRIVILEEGHNFAPEKGYGDVSSGGSNLALTYAKKIAAEGRKFHLGLIVISQRPAQISKYILAQTNTQIMFRIINNNDLQAIGSFVEFAGEDSLSLLPRLKTGIGIISGVAVPFSMLVNIGEN